MNKYLISMALLVGCGDAAGPAGPPGPQGERGATGADGTDGANGTNGTNGIDGIDGADGADGARGPTGAVGATGAPAPTAGGGQRGIAQAGSTWDNSTSTDTTLGGGQGSFFANAVGRPYTATIYAQAVDAGVEVAVPSGTWSFQLRWVFDNFAGGPGSDIAGETFDITFDGTSARQTTEISGTVPSPSFDHDIVTTIGPRLQLLSRGVPLPNGAQLHVIILATVN